MKKGSGAKAGLSVANKAGEVLVGFTKIEAAIVRTNGQLVLIHATEAAADGCRKLEGKLRKTRGDHPPVIIRIFTGVELSLALGYPNVIHAALTGGGAGDQLQRNIARLLRFSGLTKDVLPTAALQDDGDYDDKAGEAGTGDQARTIHQGCTESE